MIMDVLKVIWLHVVKLVNLSLLNLLNMVSDVMTHHQKEDDGELENFYTTLMTKPADLEGIYTIRQPVKELFFNDLKQSA